MDIHKHRELQIKSLIENLGYDALPYTPIASSKECLSVPLPNERALFLLGAAFQKEGIEDRSYIPRVSELGRGLIVYWPTIKWSEL